MTAAAASPAGRGAAGPTATVVVDLGFGDAGKGTLVDWLVRRDDAARVVRWNGGAQAGHTVVLDDGRHHTFAQLGAGTFVPGVRTHLAAPVVVHPTGLLVEVRHLAAKGVPDALDRLTIDPAARVITPWHQAANRVRELARGAARHGSCGVGVGEAVRDALEHPDDAVRARDLEAGGAALVARLGRVRERVHASLGGALVDLRGHPGAATEIALLDDPQVADRWLDAVAPLRGRGLLAGDAEIARRSPGRSIVLEGAQGVLLDEAWGFHPHTTWSTCTVHPAMAFLREAGWSGAVDRLGVLRAHATRHGEGPLPTASPELDAHLPEPHNRSDGWQGAFRVGWPDLVLARHAVAVSGGLDGLAITHLDRWARLPAPRIAVAYEALPDDLAIHDAQGRAIALRAGDLAHQERLGRALGAARPVYEAATRDAEPLLSRWESALGVPVLVGSWGPTAADKRGRPR